ncbi:MAG: hypothetical protein V3V88_00420 [Dehalococcoidia bacterium]
MEGEDTEKLWIQCEKLEKQIGDDPADILYSDKWEGIISYRQKVMEIEKDKDDYLFSLAGYKGETIESLQRKTVADINSFEERFIKDLDGRH